MDDKIVAIPHKEPFLSKFENVDQLPEMLKKQIEFFLSNYKVFENKKTEVTGWDGVEEAKKLINRCIQDYQNK
jgi:inorganic pyrophosphatase